MFFQIFRIFLICNLVLLGSCKMRSSLLESVHSSACNKLVSTYREIGAGGLPSPQIATRIFLNSVEREFGKINPKQVSKLKQDLSLCEISSADLGRRNSVEVLNLNTLTDAQTISLQLTGHGAVIPSDFLHGKLVATCSGLAPTFLSTVK